MAVAIIGAPPGFDAPRAEGGSVVIEPDAADAVLAFAHTRDELGGLISTLHESARAEHLTWIAYPKGGKLGTDLNRDVVREALQPAGSSTVRQVALDETWSALRLRT